MQVGQTIQGQNHTYYLRSSLGVPGLYGVAFSATIVNPSPATEQQEFVIKALRSDAPNDARDRLKEEADTLKAIQEAEEKAGVHYAVRLIDQSAASELEPFIVMERAYGANVLDNLLDPQRAEQEPAAYELLALRIMYTFAHALRYVHQTGRLYLDMKLDNLFWTGDEYAGSLRIIDWNVVGDASTGVASDWARFGARLYQFLTGKYLEILPSGSIDGDRPSGSAWEKLAYGVKSLINDALALRYQDDDRIYAQLGRELEQAQHAAKGDWRALLQLANQANASKAAPNEVLAPLWRASQILQNLPNSIEKENALKLIQALEQQNQERQGVGNEAALKTAFQFLNNDNIFMARQRFEQIYASTGKRDPRARRGLWACQIADEKYQVYGTVKEDLNKALEYLNQTPQNLDACRGRLTIVGDLLGDNQAFGYLKQELELLQVLQSSDRGAMTALLSQRSAFAALLTAYPDLENLFIQLKDRVDELENQEKEAISRAEFASRLDQVQQKIQQIQVDTPYRQQLQWYGELLSLLEERNLAQDEAKRNELKILIQGLRQLTEFEELRSEAQNVKPNAENWQAFEQRVAASSLAPLVSPLVSYGRWQEQQGHWQVLDERSITQLEAIETLQTELSKVQTTLDQHGNSLKDLEIRLRAVEEPLMQQGGLIEQINHNAASLIEQQQVIVDRAYVTPSDITQLQSTVSRDIHELQETQLMVADKVKVLAQQNEAISEAQVILQNQPQTDINRILTKQLAIDSVQNLIDKRLLSRASAEAVKLDVEHIRTDFENRISAYQEQAKIAFQAYEKALGEIDRDFEKPIALYQNAIQLWLDNPGFYQGANDLLNALSTFFDKQAPSLLLALQPHSFVDYIQPIQTLWRELRRTKVALVGSESTLLKSVDDLCDDVARVLKVLISLRELRASSGQSKQQCLQKAKDTLTELRHKPTALLDKLNKVTNNLSKAA